MQHMDDVKLALEELKEESNSGRTTGNAAITEQVRKPGRTRALIWSITALAVVLAGIVAFRSFDQPAETPATPIRAVPLTTYAGNEDSPSFSPDGSQVAGKRGSPSLLALARFFAILRASRSQGSLKRRRNAQNAARLQFRESGPHTGLELHPLHLRRPSIASGNSTPSFLPPQISSGQIMCELDRTNRILATMCSIERAFSN